jgi:hypothetical protein
MFNDLEETQMKVIKIGGGSLKGKKHSGDSRPDLRQRPREHHRGLRPGRDHRYAHPGYDEAAELIRLQRQSDSDHKPPVNIQGFDGSPVRHNDFLGNGQPQP